MDAPIKVNKDFQEEFGNVLRDIRLSSTSNTVQEFADYLDVTQYLLNNVEKGEINLSNWQITNLIRILRDKDISIAPLTKIITDYRIHTKEKRRKAMVPDEKALKDKYLGIKKSNQDAMSNWLLSNPNSTTGKMLKAMRDIIPLTRLELARVTAVPKAHIKAIELDSTFFLHRKDIKETLFNYFRDTHGICPFNLTQEQQDTYDVNDSKPQVQGASEPQY